MGVAQTIVAPNKAQMTLIFFMLVSRLDLQLYNSSCRSRLGFNPYPTAKSAVERDSRGDATLDMTDL
jgi:hypothetical protein